MSSIEIFARATKIPVAEFAAWFSQCKRSAFRLELLPAFRVPSEVEALKAFRAGAQRPTTFNDGWHDTLRRARDRGASFTRLRLVPDPMTDYFAFETAWGYAENNKFGETIRFATPANLGTHVNGLPFVIDYWAFDRTAVFPMMYDFEGRFLGVVQLAAQDAEPFFVTAEADLSTLPGLEWALKQNVIHASVSQ